MTSLPLSHRPGRASRASHTRDERSIGLRQELSSSLRLADAMPCTRLVSTWPACFQPMWSRISNALLQKSRTWPASRYILSVAAANTMSAISRWDMPRSIAVRSERSAPSSSRTSMKLRNQSLNTSGLVSPVGKGSTRKRGGPAAHSDATCLSPWYSARGLSSLFSRSWMFAAQVSIVIACPQPCAE